MRVFLVYLTVCLIWSSTWIFIKLGLDAGLPPIGFAATRFLIAFAVLMLILAVQKIGLPRDKRVWALAGVSGVLQFFVNYGLLFWGEQHISSGLAAVLQATIPGFGLVFAQIHVPDERVTIFKLLAVLLGIAGVGAIFYEQLHLSGALAFAGSAAVIAGAACASYASVLTKAFGGKIETSSLLAAQMLCGLVPLALVAFVVEGNPFAQNWTWTAVFSVFYLALAGSVAAFWLYYWLLKRLAVTKAMMISLVTPVVAVVIGALVLGETLPPQTLAGGALILLSVAFVLLRRD